MKKFKEMKNDNKGFSLVELIVVIAIMVVLVAVLGSTILGYVEKSKYSKDIQALDSIKTATSLLISDPDSDYSDAKEGTTLLLLMQKEENKEIVKTLKEVFTIDGEGTSLTAEFNNSSEAFDGLDAGDVKIKIVDGAISIYAPVHKDVDADSFKPYRAGTEYETETSAFETETSTFDKEQK